MSGTAGNDTFNNVSDKVTVDGAAGNDSITSYGENVSIFGGDGNDTITNSYYGEYATINTGAGNDYVYNGYYAHSSKISLGAGNDTIVSDWSEALTLNGGKGNDLIKMDREHKGNVIEYAAGDGNDTIHGFNPTDTLNLTGGSVTSSSVSGDDLILKVGTGSITFVNARSVNVNGTIFNPTSNTGTNAHDFITNFDDNATINALGGDDKIANSGSNVLINTGEGNNSVGNYGDNTTIVTGNGNNTIYSDTTSTIKAGTGMTATTVILRTAYRITAPQLTAAQVTIPFTLTQAGTARRLTNTKQATATTLSTATARPIRLKSSGLTRPRPSARTCS